MTWTKSKTFEITSIVPSSADIAGGTAIIFSGDFSVAAAQLPPVVPTVAIYGTDCPLVQHTDSLIECTLAVKPATLIDTPLEISYPGFGIVATHGMYVKYIDPAKPQISAISPNSGSVLGGTLITLSGLGLNDVTDVMIGDHVCEISLQAASLLSC